MCVCVCVWCVCVCVIDYHWKFFSHDNWKSIFMCSFDHGLRKVKKICLRDKMDLKKTKNNLKQYLLEMRPMLLEEFFMEYMRFGIYFWTELQPCFSSSVYCYWEKTRSNKIIWDCILMLTHSSHLLHFTVRFSTMCSFLCLTNCRRYCLTVSLLESCVCLLMGNLATKFSEKKWNPELTICWDLYINTSSE